MPFCYFPGCLGKEVGVKYFRFPKLEKEQSIWLHIINSEKLKEKSSVNLYKNVKICSKHFAQTDLVPSPYPGTTTKGLKKGAIPIRDHSKLANVKISSNMATDESIISEAITDQTSQNRKTKTTPSGTIYIKEDKATALRDMRICRFCLTQNDPLTNIYEKDVKNAISLPPQITACVAIEIFSNDGMPQLICDDCRLQTRKSYSFKTMCRRSDDTLKLFLTTGVLTKHEKEEILKPKNFQKRSIETKTSSSSTPKRIKTSETSIQDTLDDSDKTLQQIKYEIIIKDSIKNDHSDTDTHVKIHSERKSFICKVCYKTFTSAILLHQHENIHVPFPKYHCTYCGKTYLISDDLDTHMVIHKKSSQCEKSCAFKQGLKHHLKTVNAHVSSHLSGLHFSCDKCDYFFETQEELEDHEVKHTDYYDDEEEENTVEDHKQQELLEGNKVIINDQLSKIRKSQRESKIKNYIDILKDELELDSDEKLEQEETDPLIQTGTIQPVIISVTMKMYKGIKDKSTGSVKIIPENPILEPPVKLIENFPKSMTKITTLENLGISKQTLDAMTDKSGFVEIKLGQKVIRVQKLMMPKAEYQQMAKKGKLEMKGSTLIVQNMDINKLSKPAQQDPLNESSKLSEQKVEMQADGEVQLSKTLVRTYEKEIIVEKCLQFEDTGNNIDLEMNPAIHDTSIEETYILGKF